MDQQGIISRYKIKYMKTCEYLRLNNMEISAGYECGRVPPNNTKNFDEFVIDGNLTSCTLNNLTPYVNYHCEVCAGTVKGFGPCGSMNYKTDEFGNVIYLLSHCSAADAAFCCPYVQFFFDKQSWTLHPGHTWRGFLV